MNLDKLKKVDQSSSQFLVMTAKNEFKLIQIEGDFEIQKKQLKSYILRLKGKADIILNKKKHPEFETFRLCFNQVNQIYQEIWESLAKEKFKKTFNKLSITQKESIIEEYPVKFK